MVMSCEDEDIYQKFSHEVVMHDIQMWMDEYLDIQFNQHRSRHSR
jgi:hypothetical protein